MNNVGRVKYGTDKELEELANQLLAEGVGDNHRSIARDIEKMSHGSGPSEHYDPTNDWDTQDSVFTIYTQPNDLEFIEPSICDGHDGNVRARNPALQQRKDLMRHVGEDDDWGPTREKIPLLGINEGPRKTCTKCKKSKGFMLFSPDTRNRDDLRSWCKQCEKESSKIRYTRK